MRLIDFKDAVNASVLDPNAAFAVYYEDGLFANLAAVRARCPHAHLYAITVFGKTGPGVFACDCENGDLTPAQAEQWVREQLALNVSLVCVYASLDTWVNQGLRIALAKYGDRIKRWVADYDNTRVVLPWADAAQYATGNVDRDVALANFFQAAAPAHIAAKPRGKARATIEIDLTTLEMTITPEKSTSGPIVWRPEHAFAAKEVELGVGGPIAGRWRQRGLPFNAAPLGG